MKEIRETKLVEQTTVRFIANDGKEFETESECLNYERRLNKEKVEKAFKKIAKEIKTPFLTWYMYEVETWLVSLRNDEDFEKVVDYCLMIDAWNGENDYIKNKPTAYPCKMFIMNNKDTEWCGIVTKPVEEIKNELATVLSQLDE